jgi:hypothetical protein
MEWKKGGPINIAKTLLSTQVAELCVGLQMPARFHPSVSRQYRLTLFADNTSKASKRKLVNTQTSETLQRIDQSTDQHIIKGQINRWRPTANHGFEIEGAMIGKVTVHSAE